MFIMIHLLEKSYLVLEITAMSEFAFVIVCLCGYVGLFLALMGLGPTVGFVCGGFLLQMYTHFDTIDTSASVHIGFCNL